MKKLLQNILFVLLLPLIIKAQSSSSGFDTTYALGPSNIYWGKASLVQTTFADSNLLLFAGYTRRDSIDLDVFTGIVPMLGACDYAGNLLWWKPLSFEMPKYTYGLVEGNHLIAKISPGKYVMGASPVDTTSYLYNEFNPYLLFFNAQGDTLKRVPLPAYQFKNPAPVSQLMALHVDAHKNILTTGRYFNEFTEFPDSSGISICKFDSAGNLKWRKNYPSVMDNGHDMGYQSFKLLSSNDDNGYIIGGLKGGYDSISQMPYHYLKTDTAGNVLWQKHLPKPIPFDTFCRYEMEQMDVINANNGSGYYFNAIEMNNSCQAFMYYIGKLNEQGNVAWAKTYTFPDPFLYYVMLYDMLQMNNGDLIYDVVLIDRNSPAPYNYSGTALLCTDSLGNFKWQKSYRNYLCAGSWMGETHYGFAKTPYNGIFMGGFQSINEPIPGCYEDTNFLSRLTLIDSMGRRSINDTQYLGIVYDIDEVDYSHLGIKPTKNKLTDLVELYPNPTSSNLYIKFKQSGNFTAKITDISGKQVQAIKLSAAINNINIEKWQSGIYFISFFNQNTFMGSVKIVKQ